MIVKDGLIQYVNNVLIRLSGYTEKELVGQPFIKYVAQNNQDIVSQFYNKRVAGNDSPIAYEASAVIKGKKNCPWK